MARPKLFVKFMFAVCVVTQLLAVGEDGCNYDRGTNVGSECSGTESKCTDWACSMSAAAAEGMAELDYGSIANPTYLLNQTPNGAGNGQVKKSVNSTNMICYKLYACVAQPFVFHQCSAGVGCFAGGEQNCFEFAKGDETSSVSHNIFSQTACGGE